MHVENQCQWSLKFHFISICKMVLLTLKFFKLLSVSFHHFESIISWWSATHRILIINGKKMVALQLSSVVDNSTTFTLTCPAKEASPCTWRQSTLFFSLESLLLYSPTPSLCCLARVFPTATGLLALFTIKRKKMKVN